MDILKLLEKVKKISEEKGWRFIEFQENIGMASFTKNQNRINIYLTKMTVGSCIKHPKKGKTQLFRKNCTLKDIQDIFKNPRVHTGFGYYTK